MEVDLSEVMNGRMLIVDDSEDCITKPFDKGETIARIQNQLKIRHLT
jgi:hypothetical protein